jgi:hypothetical protein
MTQLTYSTATIDAEIALCTPLCQPCHKREEVRCGGYKNRTPRGDKNKSSLLAGADIPIIRVLLSIGCTQREIAGRYGVSPATISDIATERCWTHITQPEDYPLFAKDKGR